MKLLGWISDANLTYIIGFGFVAALFMMVMGISRRNSTSLIAEMDEKRWSINVWMKRPVPMWKGKLTKPRNGMELKYLSLAYPTEINRNDTLVLKNETANNLVYIPARLARQPEVKAFFVDYFKSEASKNVNQDTKNAIFDFIEGKED